MNFTGTQRMSMAVRTKFHDSFLVKCEKNIKGKDLSRMTCCQWLFCIIFFGGMYFTVLVCDCCFPHSCNRAQEDTPGLQEAAEEEVRLWSEGHAPTSGCFLVVGDSSRDLQGNTSCVQSCGETPYGETGQNSLALPIGLR